MNVLIVEDESSAAKRLTRMLQETDASIAVAAVCGSVAAAVDWIRKNPPADLAFFDIQLGDGDSFEVFAQVDVGCPVIFTTAHDEHALEAFKVHALDYLLKPLKKEDLARALEHFATTRVVRDNRPLADESRKDPAPIAPIKRFLIRYGDHFKVVEPKDIAYIYSLEKNTFLRTREGRDLPLDESLDRLEKQLDTEKFFRMNRQLIVQLHSIKELLAYSKSRVKVMLDPPFGEDAIVSSERSAEFKRWLAGELG